jgi:glutamine synthetase
MIGLDELHADVAAGRVDEVVVALPDLQGRLQGQRLDAAHFLERVAWSGLDCCTYLLAVDVDMVTGPGYAISPGDLGFGDLRLVPDLATLRRLPWDPGTALVLADAHWPDGTPVEVAPRRVLQRQLERLSARGLRALAGTELEFVVYRESYAEAHARGYADLTPATRHNVDYALQGLGEVEPLARRIRQSMREAGLRLESARGECHPGQYEIVFRYDDALAACDAHVLYKAGAKEIAAQAGQALTFMAKVDEGEGNSGHVHLSLRSRDGDPVLAGHGTGDRAGMSPLMEAFLAGQLEALADLTLMHAPNVNSYKRLQPGAFAPTAVAWGRDNRTCPVRVVGAGESLRIEHRVPGADANPYLSVAAVVAAGLEGIERELEPPPALAGDAGAAEGLAPLPRTLRGAVDRWTSSGVARAAFGDTVVEHYAQAARVELAAFDRAVTDWERRRGFERL